MKLIGLAGPKGSGKTTFASMMSTLYGWKGISFAYPIKAMLEAMGVPQEIIRDPVRKEEVFPELGVSPRRLMQTLRTEWMREIIDPDGWVRLAEARIRRCDRNVVVDDVRFENECRMIKSLGGTLVRFDKSLYGVDSHKSESGIPDEFVDVEIDGFRDSDPYTGVKNFMENVYNGAVDHTEPTV